MTEKTDQTDQNVETEETEERKKARKTSVTTYTPKKIEPGKPDNSFHSAGNEPAPPPMPEPEPEPEPEADLEPAPAPQYQEPLGEFAGLRVPEHTHFKNRHRQRGAYIEHELDAILRQQQALRGKGTVTKIINDALREYFKKHKIKYIERTDGGAQHGPK